MLDNEAIIYLSENRKCILTETFRSLITLPNKNLKSPFESIIKFADNTLMAQKTSTLLSDYNCIVVLFPLVGAIEITDKKNVKIVNSGEIAYVFLQKDSKIFVQNPFENELVNYLEIWINREEILAKDFLINPFDLENNKNKLIELSPNNLDVNVFVGKFDGREEVILNIQSNAFVFIINGVFEVNNRLLESRVGLELWNLTKIEFEGLGVENIILIITK